MADLIIVGGGAASQAAAVYALGKGLDFLMIYESLGGRAGDIALSDRDYQVGGILVHFDFPDAEDDEAVLIGSSVIHHFEKQIKRRPEHLIQDRVVRVIPQDGEFQVETLRHGTQQARAVIIATGAEPRHLPESVDGAHLVADLGYATTIHASLFAGKSVAVIAGDSSALYGVAEIARTASQVAVVVQAAGLLESSIGRVLRNHPTVTVYDGYQVASVSGEVGAVQLALQGWSSSRQLQVDAVFSEMGCQPHTSIVQGVVETDRDGYIIVDKHNATNVAGLFAAGDVTTPFAEQVLVAIGDGARAVMSAHHYLLEQAAMRQSGG